jgi:hypothetical protein
MIHRTDIVALAIRLTTADRVVFHFLAHRDGGLQRQGTARLRDPAGELHIGVVRDPIFPRIVEALPDDILEQPGSFAIPGDGAQMLLQIELWTAAGSQAMAIAYGADGEGPPEDIVRFVLRARELSDPWYRQAQEDAARVPG